MRLIRLAVIAVLAFPGSGIGTARAAHSYDNCTGFIDSIPATITSQGTWCLRRNLSTAIDIGTAITIANNNVTLDCNDFRIGGLAAGAASQAVGIRTSNRSNITVRNCNIRGFSIGVRLEQGSGHIVENNHLNDNLFVGINIHQGSQSVIRRNRIQDTGGSIVSSSALAISSHGADVIENDVSNIYGVFPESPVWGIWVSNPDVEQEGKNHISVRENRIAGIDSSENRQAIGIYVRSFGVEISDNTVATSSPNQAHGILAENGIYFGHYFCRRNTMISFAYPMTGCSSVSGNLTTL